MTSDNNDFLWGEAECPFKFRFPLNPISQKLMLYISKIYIGEEEINMKT